MGLSDDAEKLIIAALIREPVLLEKAQGLDVNAFSRAEHRKIFVGITEIWEDHKPEYINELELSKRTGVSLADLQKASEGCYVLRSERFLDIFSELLRIRCIEKIIPLLDSELKRYVKTGDYDSLDFEKIRRLFNEFSSLEANACTGPKSIQLSDVEPEPVSWLWQNYFPISKINLISGDPGAGKTWLCLDIAARLSTGRDWPDGSPGSGCGGSLILSCEDGAADTYRPRLDKLKADSSKIYLLQNPLDLSNEAGRQKLVAEIGLRNPRLVIIDPILDFSGKVNPNAVDQVRAMLTPLAEIIEKSKATLILTSHLNKSSVMQALYRTAGSASGWVGKARAVFMVVKDKTSLEANQPFRRLFAPIKTNLSPVEPRAYFFNISDNPGLTYERVPVDFNLETFLASDHRELGPQLEEAKSSLTVLLKNGPVAATEVMRQAQELGIKEKTLLRAKKLLDPKVYREGGSHGRWMWGLEK